MLQYAAVSTDLVPHKMMRHKIIKKNITDQLKSINLGLLEHAKKGKNSIDIERISLKRINH